MRYAQKSIPRFFELERFHAVERTKHFDLNARVSFGGMTGENQRRDERKGSGGYWRD